jgi:hypothetical protein
MLSCDEHIVQTQNQYFGADLLGGFQFQVRGISVLYKAPSDFMSIIQGPTPEAIRFRNVI